MNPIPSFFMSTLLFCTLTGSLPTEGTGQLKLTEGAVLRSEQVSVAVSLQEQAAPVHTGTSLFKGWSLPEGMKLLPLNAACSWSPGQLTVMAGTLSTGGGFSDSKLSGTLPARSDGAKPLSLYASYGAFSVAAVSTVYLKDLCTDEPAAGGGGTGAAASSSGSASSGTAADGAGGAALGGSGIGGGTTASESGAASGAGADGAGGVAAAWLAKVQKAAVEASFSGIQLIHAGSWKASLDTRLTAAWIRLPESSGTSWFYKYPYHPEGSLVMLQEKSGAKLVFSGSQLLVEHTMQASLPDVSSPALSNRLEMSLKAGGFGLAIEGFCAPYTFLTAAGTPETETASVAAKLNLAAGSTKTRQFKCQLHCSAGFSPPAAIKETGRWLIDSAMKADYAGQAVGAQLAANVSGISPDGNLHKAKVAVQATCRDESAEATVKMTSSPWNQEKAPEWNMKLALTGRTVSASFRATAADSGITERGISISWEYGQLGADLSLTSAEKGVQVQLAAAMSW